MHGSLRGLQPLRHGAQGAQPLRPRSPTRRPRALAAANSKSASAMWPAPASMWSSSAAGPPLKCQVLRAGRASERARGLLLEEHPAGRLRRARRRHRPGTLRPPLRRRRRRPLPARRRPRNHPITWSPPSAFTPEVTLQQGIVCEGSLTVRAALRRRTSPSANSPPPLSKCWAATWAPWPSSATPVPASR